MVNSVWRRSIIVGAAFAPLKKKINDIESLTAKLQKQIQAVDKELEDQDLYDKHPEKAAA